MRGNERFGRGEMMVDQPENMAFAIGEIRGQLRELIHTSNNTAQKVDTLAVSVSMAAGLPESVALLAARVTALEAAENRRDGAAGILGNILKSPTLGWIVGGVTTVYLAVTGKLDL